MSDFTGLTWRKSSLQAAGRRTEAVRIFRELTGASLTEANRAVSNLGRTRAGDEDAVEPERSRPCRRAAHSPRSRDCGLTEDFVNSHHAVRCTLRGFGGTSACYLADALSRWIATYHPSGDGCSSPSSRPAPLNRLSSHHACRSLLNRTTHVYFPGTLSDCRHTPTTCPLLVAYWQRVLPKMRRSQGLIPSQEERGSTVAFGGDGGTGGGN